MEIRILSAAAALTCAAAIAIAAADDKKDAAPPPTCTVAQLEAPANNAQSVAENISGVAQGITARALGANRVVICGDDTRGAVASLAAAAAKSGRETVTKPTARESHMVRLFHNRDSAGVAQVLQKGFPKLNVSALGPDTLVLGGSDPSDAALARSAKRWIAFIDVPRPEVTLNVWSVQVSSKDPETVNRLATDVRLAVSEHNRALQEALGRAHAYLAAEAEKAEFHAPVFKGYLAARYVAAGQSGVNINRGALGACAGGEYCLGYRDAFGVEPNISSLLLNVLAARDRSYAIQLVNLLENRRVGGVLVNTKSYAAMAPAPTKKSLSEIYGTTTGVDDCEAVAKAVYEKRAPSGPNHVTAPAFPCLREALSDATEPVALARIRMAIANFLFNQKFRHQYPDDFAPENSSSAWMDSMAGPLLASFNRDMTSFLRAVRDEIQGSGKSRRIEFSSNGIVTLATLSSIPSSVATSSQSAFQLPPTFSLKDFLATSAPPVAAQGQTPAQAVAAKLPGFLAANLVPGVAVPLAAALSMDATPAVASIGRNLTLLVTSNTLPGASAAELNVNLVSQEEAPPTVQRGADSKPDLKSRVAKHNLQTVVRVDSLRLFELSSFSAEVRRGGDSIPILPVPYLEIPGIGGILRLPRKPGQVFHRSFAIVSAVVLPTSADLASAVTPLPDMILTPVVPTLRAQTPDGSGWNATYTVVAERQDGDLASSLSVNTTLPTNMSPVRLTWERAGDDARYSIYRAVGGGTPQLLRENLDVAHFEDKNAPPLRAAAPPDAGLAAAYTQIAPATFLAGGVRGFHQARLDCISREALNQPLGACDQRKLADFPAEK